MDTAEIHACVDELCGRKNFCPLTDEQNIVARRLLRYARQNSETIWVRHLLHRAEPSREGTRRVT